VLLTNVGWTLTINTQEDEYLEDEYLPVSVPSRLFSQATFLADWKTARSRAVSRLALGLEPPDPNPIAGVVTCDSGSVKDTIGTLNLKVDWNLVINNPLGYLRIIGP
jgi:hypothetical protein